MSNIYAEIEFMKLKLTLTKEEVKAIGSYCKKYKTTPKKLITELFIRFANGCDKEKAMQNLKN